MLQLVNTFKIPLLSVPNVHGHCFDFPGGTVDKNLPANAADMGSIPGPEIFYSPTQQLGFCATTTEPRAHEPQLGARGLQLLKPQPRACAPLQGTSPQGGRNPHTAATAQCSQNSN